VSHHALDERPRTEFPASPGSDLDEREPLDEFEAGELAVEYDSASPQEVLAWALDRFHPRIAISAGGGAEGMVIVDMAWRVDPSVRVFTLDTGRLPQETHDLFDRVRERYGIEVEVQFPEAPQLEKLVRAHGTNPMYRSVDLRLLCCQVRKVLPLVKYLDGMDGWITGLMREQWATRSDIRKIEVDHDHGGIAKVNPLADWTKREVWEYVRENDVPYHELYDKGYTSIGCAPCTRAVEPGESDRSGRWWWETNAPKECGIHCSIYTGGFEHELHALLGPDVGGNGFDDAGRGVGGGSVLGP
jgi:phosphoadenosine phosphosulfate reductase